MAKKNSIVKIADITQFANFMLRSIRTRLKWSSKLRGAVRLGKAVDKNGVVSIAITVGEGDKDKAGMARAYEYGSGIHGRVGRTYKIKRKNARALWFPFPSPRVYPGTMTFIKNGQFGITVSEVDHPGVSPRPFIAPAREEAIRRALPELKVAIRRNLVDNLKTTLKQVTK